MIKEGEGGLWGEKKNTGKAWKVQDTIRQM